jgi:hypothetical protein
MSRRITQVQTCANRASKPNPSAEVRPRAPRTVFCSAQAAVIRPVRTGPMPLLLACILESDRVRGDRVRCLNRVRNDLPQLA